MIRRYIGMDLSLAHGAMNAIDEDGSLFEAVAYCSEEKDHQPPGAVERIPAEVFPKKRTEGDWAKKNLDRLLWYVTWLNTQLPRLTLGADEIHFALEDYAYNADHGAHQLGEVGGHARIRIALLARSMAAQNRAVFLRMHDIGGAKIYATGNGNADKEEMLAAVAAHYGHEWLEFRPQAKRTKKEPKNPPQEKVREDVNDAFVLADMIRLEDQVRRGAVLIQDCEPRQIRIFNRTTSRYPENLLNRPYAVGGLS